MKSLFIATPMFGGQCYGGYTLSLISLVRDLRENNYDSTYNFIYNESLINRARNNLAESFLRSDCTHLLFIDADISFYSNDVIKMLSFDLPVIAAMYPKKHLNFDKFKRSLESGKSFDDAMPDLYDQVGAVGLGEDPVIISNKNNMDLKRFVYAGTGFMMISREAFDRLIPKVPMYFGHFDKANHQIYDFFSISIERETNILLSEDYHFCKLCNDNDIPIYVAPWIRLQHTGTYTFGVK